MRDYEGFSTNSFQNKKENLKEEFQLITPNIKTILTKKNEKINNHEKEFILSALKKINFIKSSFDTNSPTFWKLLTGLGMISHEVDGIVFEKGDWGEYFYIVLEGVYCVEGQNTKEGKKQKQIFYEAGDSFGQVSLIYDVPRGARILADTSGTLLTIKKEVFNNCGNLKENILYLNNFFSSHSYFQKQNQFMIRVVSSISKLCKFQQKQLIVDEGVHFNEILFFVKGQAKVFKTLNLFANNQHFTQTLEIQTLSEGDVYGEHFYTNKEPSSVRIIGINRGEFIRVAFKDNIHAVENELYRRIRQNAAKFPEDGEFLNQFRAFLQQKYKELSFLCDLYTNNEKKKKQKNETKRKLKKIMQASLVENS